MDSRALAERLRNSRATAAEDPRFRERQAAAEEARRQRTETALKRAEQIIADLLSKLDDGTHSPGTQPEVMRTDGDSETATIVFNRLMEAARESGSGPCWYPVRDREVDMCDDHYGVIKLCYGICPSEPDRD